MGTLSPREFTPDDVDLLSVVANTASIAIEHARLFAAERQARLRLEGLQWVTDAALGYLELETLLAELMRRTRELLNTDTAAVLLLDENANELVARAAVGLEEEVEQGVRIPVGGGFAGRIAAERRSDRARRRRPRRRPQPDSPRERDQEHARRATHRR